MKTAFLDSSEQYKQKETICSDINQKGKTHAISDISQKHSTAISQSVQTSVDDTSLTSITLKDRNKEKKTVEKWVVQQRMPKMHFFLKTLHSDVTGAASSLQCLLKSDIFSIDVLVKTANEIEQIQNLLKERTNLLPDIEALREDYNQSFDIFMEAHPILEDDIFKLVEQGIPPKDVKEIAEILSKKDIVNFLPDWLWAAEAVSNKNMAHKRSIALSDPSVRLRISSILDALSEIDANMLEPLKNIPPPPQRIRMQIYIYDIDWTKLLNSYE